MSRYRVLWIDDELDDTDPAFAYLRSEGFQVDCAASGLVGLQCADSARYDIVLLDLRLPDILGFTVLRRLVGSHPATPVVMLTGAYIESENEAIAINAGAAAFLRKPFFVDELSVSLKRICAEYAGQRVPKEFEKPSRANASTPDRLVLKEVAEMLEGAIGQEVAPHFCRGVRVLLAHELHIGSFLAASEAMRDVLILSGGPDAQGRMAAKWIGILRERANRRYDLAPPLVRAAITALEMEATSRTPPSEQTIASKLYVDRAHLGRLLSRAMGYGFRELRRGFRIRTALSRCARSDVHFTTIARSVGYRHLSQFDRDFRTVFGMDPSAFRSTCLPGQSTTTGDAHRVHNNRTSG